MEFMKSRGSGPSQEILGCLGLLEAVQMRLRHGQPPGIRVWLSYHEETDRVACHGAQPE